MAYVLTKQKEYNLKLEPKRKTERPKQNKVIVAQATDGNQRIRFRIANLVGADSSQLSEKKVDQDILNDTSTKVTIRAKMYTFVNIKAIFIKKKAKETWRERNKVNIT